MKQLPGPKGRSGQEAVIRVVLDEDEMNRMLKPILDEVNALRARVKILESVVLDDGR